MSETIIAAEHMAQMPAPQKLTSSDWLVLVAVITVPVIVSMAAALGPFIILPLMAEFHATRGSVMFYLAFGTVGGNLLSPFVGRALTRLAPWVVMLTGATFAGAGLLLASLASSLIVVAVGFFATLAIGAVLCGILSSQTIMARRFPSLMGRALSALVIVAGILGVGMPQVIAPFLTVHGWRLTLAAAAIVVTSIPAALILLFLRKTGKPAASPAPVTIGAYATPFPASEDGGIPPTTREILTSTNFWLLLIALEPLALVISAVFPNLIPFYHDRGIEINQAKNAFSLLAASALIGALMGGISVDRVGPWIYLATISGVSFLGLVALSLDLGAPVISLIAIVIALSGIGATFGVAINRLFGPAAFAPVAGLMAPFQIASAFAGALTGWMRDEFGTYQVVFGILAGILLISLVSALVLFHMKRGDTTT